MPKVTPLVSARTWTRVQFWLCSPMLILTIFPNTYLFYSKICPINFCTCLMRNWLCKAERQIQRPVHLKLFGKICGSGGKIWAGSLSSKDSKPWIMETSCLIKWHPLVILQKSPLHSPGTYMTKYLPINTFLISEGRYK